MTNEDKMEEWQVLVTAAKSMAGWGVRVVLINGEQYIGTVEFIGKNPRYNFYGNCDVMSIRAFSYEYFGCYMMITIPLYKVKSIKLDKGICRQCERFVDWEEKDERVDCTHCWASMSKNIWEEIKDDFAGQ